MLMTYVINFLQWQKYLIPLHSYIDTAFADGFILNERVLSDLKYSEHQWYFSAIIF